MRFCVSVSAALISTALAAGNAFAQPSNGGFNSATAVRMAQACIAYARAHNAAVNVSIYNDRGELLHFQRMDGAPQLGPSFSSGPQYGGDPFRNGPGPVIAIPDTSATDGVPVIVGGKTVGFAQAVGMGDAEDRACAQAAAGAVQGSP